MHILSFFSHSNIPDIFFVRGFLHDRKKKDSNTYQGTTWQIKFKLDNVYINATYKLRVAIASATLSELQVYLNLH